MQTIDYTVFDCGITAFSTLRGKESESGNPYAGFSVCHYTGDSEEHILRCVGELSDHLGLSSDSIIIPRQSHTDRVAVIKSGKTTSLDDVDALVTAEPATALCINTADCVAVLLADENAGVIAAAHCGWRGCVNALLDNVITAMKELGANPAGITAVMGPSICPDCFEVGKEVASVFRTICPAAVIDRKGMKPHVSLPLTVRHQLRRLGLADSRISDPPLCSRCNPERLFSARASGIHSGRTLSVIMRKPTH